MSDVPQKKDLQTLTEEAVLQEEEMDWEKEKIFTKTAEDCIFEEETNINNNSIKNRNPKFNEHWTSVSTIKPFGINGVYGTISILQASSGEDRVDTIIQHQRMDYFGKSGYGTPPSNSSKF